MFDLAVIGSGPAGYTSAVGAALRGARVALIERGLPGGTCLNQGCVPSHALLHLAALIDDVRLLQDLSYCHPSWCEELERAVDASAARFVRSARDPFRPGIFAQEFVGPSPTNRG